MESFYRTHKYLVEHVQSPVRRLLMSEIDWTQRLIGIKGSRGVGKTTFLLQYAKEYFGLDRKCLYINFNNLYFTEHTLYEFASRFYHQGGRTLLIDQIFKYENWSIELRRCYDDFEDLHIVFSCSSVLRLIDGNPDIGSIVTPYNLRGFSFREYINLESGNDFSAYTLEDIIANHETIAKEICEKVEPFEYFQAYLHHGFYPFYLEKRNFSENLLKTMNMILEVDILLIKQIDLKYLSKIRKLLYKVMIQAPSAPNVSNLSVDIETSRATVMNYIKYLKDARLLNLLYEKGDDFPKKAKVVYVQNTNLIYAVSPGNVNKQVERKTFLYNALHVKHKVNFGKYHSDFLVDGKYYFKYLDIQPTRQNTKVLYAVDDVNIGSKNKIPLWLLGFLY